MGEIDLGAAAEATIQAYRELATDPGKRLALAFDRTCIQFLAYVLAEGEGNLVVLALETLSLISQEPDCRPSLAKTFGVLESLEALSDNEERYGEELREQATSLYTCLQFAKHLKKSKSRESTKSLSPTEASATPKSSTAANVASITTQTSLTSSVTESQKSDDVDTSYSATSYSVVGQGKFSIGNKGSTHGSRSTSPDEDSLKSEEMGLSPRKQQQIANNRKAKTVTLFINGMKNADQRLLVEAQLVRTRGLISIVFDLASSRVTCRVKRDLSIEKLAIAVARTNTLTAQHVIRGANGEEIIQPIGADATSAASPVEELPDYLPEEEEAIKDGTTMATAGTFRETATSFLSTAANILQKSFYW